MYSVYSASRSLWTWRVSWTLRYVVHICEYIVTLGYEETIWKRQRVVRYCNDHRTMLKTPLRRDMNGALSVPRELDDSIRARNRKTEAWVVMSCIERVYLPTSRRPARFQPTVSETTSARHRNPRDTRRTCSIRWQAWWVLLWGSKQTSASPAFSPARS